MGRRLGDRPSAGMTSPAPGKSFISGTASPFVGRDRELGRLVAALSLAAEGEGRTVFLSGQSGTGKTRLAREALALAKDRGFMVLEGRAYPLEAGMAYAPIVDAFGPVLRNYDRFHLRVLTSGLPSLGRIFEGLQLPAPSFPSDGLYDAALEKTRLFEAVACLLERLTQEAPVALLLDDLHWADPASLEMLHYLARGLPKERAMLLVTYSTDALSATSGLRVLIESLRRRSLSDEVALARLGPGTVDELVRGILNGEAPHDLLALLDARAGGIPLFVEALLAALVGSGNLARSAFGRKGWIFDADRAFELPQNVRRLILERLDRLAPLERRVLDLLAVCSDATAHAVLRAASGMEEDTLLDALRRLRAAGLVADGIDGLVSYSITQPLVQEVAYDVLPEMERRRAHMAAIKALESFSEGQSNDNRRLARHYRGAGPEADSERALSVLVDAGERALNLYANEEAARHFEAALAIVRRARGSSFPSPGLWPPSPEMLPWLLERLGEAWERIGKPGAAVKVWNEALAERERAGEDRAAARLQCCLSLAEWDRGHIDRANAHLEAGMVLLGERLADREPCQELADLYFVRYHILLRLRDMAGVGETAEQLVSIAERLASPRAEAEANLAVANFALAQGDADGARRRATHALMVAEQARDLAMCCRAHVVLVSSCVALGDHRLMRFHAERGLAAARRLGAPSVEVVFRVRLAYADFLSGACGESLHRSQEAVRLAKRVGYTRTLAQALAESALILALQGDPLEAASCISQVRTLVGSSSGEGPADRAVFGLIDIVETVLALERGDMERAMAIARSFVRRPAQLATPTSLTGAYMPIVLTLLAEAQVAARDAESALETAHQISALGPAGNQYVSALVSRAEGLARGALGQWAAAVDCLTRSYKCFIALEMPFEAARSLLEQAAAVRAVDPGAAATAAQQSLAIFDDLGAGHYADRARRLLTVLGISPPRPRPTRLNNEALSKRELQIARLVAEGLTTPDIAKRLFLSSRTVSSHLHHVYVRLGIGSRAALARYVTEAGLLRLQDGNK